MEKTNWVAVELGEYLNNKGVSWCDKNIKATINHINESLAGELIPNNETKIYYDIPFKFPKTDTFQPDMISLEEQRMKLPKGRYQAIAFLGFSTWGDFYDFVTLEYMNGEIDEIPFGFCEWQQFNNSNNNNDKIQMEYYRYLDEKIDRKTGLEINIIRPDANKYLEFIVLPDNAYTYIMSVSLLK